MTRQRQIKFSTALAGIVLGSIVLGCVFADQLASLSPRFLDVNHVYESPGRDFLFGTDGLGRDLFSSIWHGGQVSLTISILATVISTGIAVIYGALSGLNDSLEGVMMRFLEIVLSVPTLLSVVFFQGIFGRSVVGMAVAIGLTGWCTMAKVVATEVKQIRTAHFFVASKAMGGGFFHLLIHHLAPNFLPAVIFMIVMELRTAMIFEATLSFMGLGLPIDVVSWGSLLAFSNRSLFTGAWWMVVIPGLFLVVTLFAITALGEAVRRQLSPKETYLH
ncbi:ABC transporter permease [Peptoniphilus equinus]|uniref:ABC transporter permease n=1 Tax=Peptoniphilus equinus TaxID=3016343 RepID=A0ABY7QTC8_9FIRM|nr:ABC transporter permease [Peptoniphilus equinus]WBW49334.1 ABC transporter permease [Peptoniphilus equinus]